MFSVFTVFSQTNNGVGLNYSPAGSLETVFDNYGVKRTLEDVRISPKKDVRSNERILFSTQLCSSGIFDLYFEDGSGMNSTTISDHIARRAVVCQVFQDLSNFINAPAGTRINFWVRNISQVPNVSSQTLGVATGFYNLPSTSIATNFSIADNEIWKTIHAGVDSYTNVTSPITSTAGLGSFYHGMMAINFNNLNWNLNLNATALSNQLDLYTVVLHEVTHALGFASLIDANGNSKFGENFDYYSRYDTFLVDHESKPLITNQNSCNEMYNFQFTVDQNVLHPNCTNSADFTNTGASINATVCINSLGFLGDSVYVPIYTPQCFENGSSLSHFEDQCFTSTTAGATNGNDLYFVMSNANNYGINKRFLKPEEREALCNMGYRLNSTFGNAAQYSFINYGGSTCNGSTVAGINDGINGLDFSYIVNISTPIQLNPITSRILANDVTTNPANLRFECVEDISFTGSNINVIGNDTNASIIFQSPIPGMHLLRYVPFDNVSGNRGNITYIYVFVSGMSTADSNGDGPNTSTFNCAIPSTCNLVLNGDFEQNANPPGPPSVTSQINRACGWTNANQLATCDYYRTNAVAHTNGTIYMSIPNNFAGNQNVNNGLGNAYAGIYYIQNLNNTQILYSEILATRLAQPLLPNSTYKLNLDVSMAESFSNINRRIQLQAYLGFNAPFQNPNNYDLPIETNGILLTNVEFSSNVNGWDTLNIEFNTGDIAGQEYLYIGGIQNVSFENIPLSNLDVTSYYYIDNVSLIPIPNDALNLPTQICQTNQLTNLTDYLGVIPNDGVFTGDGVILDHNIYTFNPTNLPTGVATINYTYNLSNGCGEITISDTIIITQTCVVPYVSQVYNNGEGNSFIEVKNPSNEEIPAGIYFLNLYQDGASTTLMPTSFMDIGLLLPNEARVFQT
ncbi:hypothetical protein, partial [Flavobacterium sp.]|uniref:hypothetical protein n=1 Tax=Flavobacterium sp. TaxID=239 RepID=UPI0037508315